MDNPYYRYRAAPDREAISWPGGKSIALIVQVHLEYWQLDAPDDAVRDARFVGEYGSFAPDCRTWSQREYGNRVGIFRLLEVLDRYPLKLTVPANAACVGRHPFLLEQLARRGAEFVGHGVSANRMVSSRMLPAEESELIAACVDALERGTGRRPVGWCSQDAGESASTPELLAKAGIRYVMDWPNDDSPYLLSTTTSPLVSLPLQPEWDDVQQLWLRRLSTPRYASMVPEAFEVLSQESGRVFVLSLHPWLIGMAHRIRYLDLALQRIFGSAGAGRIWAATGSEVAEAAAGFLGSSW